MQSLNNTSMISSGGLTVSGIGIIPNTVNASVNVVGHPMSVSSANNQTTHQISQPTNIQLIIATKSLPQALPVATVQGGGQCSMKQDVITIPVSSTSLGCKQEMIALPVVSQVTTAMYMTPSQINTLNNNQIFTTSALNTNVITTNNLNTFSQAVTLAGQAVTPGLDLLACIECGKHFVSVAKLQSHEKTHSKSRPFKCIDCNKSFTVRYSLICHTRTHTRERPYQCSQCGSRFTQASSLKTHQIYKHTKNFPYACKQCDRGFISPGQRHEHVVRTHLKLSGSVTSRSKSKSSKSKSNQQSNNVNTNNCNMTLANTTSANNNQHDINNTVTLVNATILQPVDASTQVQSGQIDTEHLPPGSTITLAIQAITAPDSDDSLGPSMSSAACQTALSLPPLL